MELEPRHIGGRIGSSERRVLSTNDESVSIALSRTARREVPFRNGSGTGRVDEVVLSEDLGWHGQAINTGFASDDFLDARGGGFPALEGLSGEAVEVGALEEARQVVYLSDSTSSSAISLATRSMTTL
jgi:hypothetical protein